MFHGAADGSQRGKRLLATLAGVCKRRHDTRVHSVRLRVAALIAAQQEQPQPRVHRVVDRALAKWRGSTVAGYAFRGDDKTICDEFRTTPQQLGMLLDLLHGSKLDTYRFRHSTSSESTHQRREPPMRWGLGVA